MASSQSQLRQSIFEPFPINITIRFIDFAKFMTVYKCQMNRRNLSYGRIFLSAIVALCYLPSGLEQSNAQDSPDWEANIRAKNLESVVFISVKAKMANGLEETITGTGFIVDPSGLVLTCNHVIPEEGGNYKSVEAFGSVGGRHENPYPLNTVRRDKDADLMLVRLESNREWKSVAMRGDAHIGSKVVALGFPEDQELITPVGDITGYARNGAWFTGAGLDYGMSGSPVFIQSGAVVGIVAGGYPNAKSLDIISPITFAMPLLQSTRSPLLTNVVETEETPKPTPLPTPADHWKLVFYDHFTPGALWEVEHTDVSKADVRNGEFRSWCAPFNVNSYDVLEVVTVAKGEHWQVSSQFLTERGLPMLSERWFQIMDDEIWYAYRVRLRR